MLYTQIIFSCGGWYSCKTKFRDQDVDYVGLYTGRIDLILYFYSTINVPFLGLSHIFFILIFIPFLFIVEISRFFKQMLRKRRLIFLFLLKNFVWQFLITFLQMGVKARNLRFGVISYLIKPNYLAFANAERKSIKINLPLYIYMYINHFYACLNTAISV